MDNPNKIDDPISTDPGKYRVIFENEKVRVLDYLDAPGDKTNQHTHPAFVLYAFEPFKRRLHLPDGRTIDREFKSGDVIYSEGQTHIGENVGETPTHILMIEFKNNG